MEFLRFEVANRSFCVDVDQVLGVITLPPNLRDAPAAVPFHEEQIPVYSIEKLFEFEEKPTRCPKEIIVLSGASENYGISVDLIGQIYKVPVQRSVFRFPASGRSQIKMFGIWGMAVLGNDLALVLEPQELLKEQNAGPGSQRPCPTASPRTPDRPGL